MQVSILEIYNETLVDLLVGRSGAKLEVMRCSTSPLAAQPQTPKKTAPNP